MQTAKVKNGFLIGFLCAFIGAFQMYWFLPSGMSCLDLNIGLFEAVLKFMSIQFVIIIFIFLALKEKISIYIISVFLCFFWFYVNKYEFTHRYACWSTFSQSEILLVTFNKSLVPILICLLSFIISFLFFF